MKNLELPKKYHDCVKSLVYNKERKQYELSLATGVIANTRFYECTSKKAVLEFLKQNMYYEPWLYKAKYAQRTVNEINRWRFNSGIEVQVYFNLHDNEFYSHVETCNTFHRYRQSYIIHVANYHFWQEYKMNKDELIVHTIEALYKYFYC